MNDRNQDGDLDALFALARARRPDTSAAEFAFETRLLARLRARQETGLIWATVSWRLVPFFAAGIVALTLWHSQVVTETNEAAAMAEMATPENVDLWSNLN
jgi:hypothetical protein